MTDPTDGGTVRYHRADWVPERDRWVVTFPGGRVQGFTAEQGEAMGLTSPKPEAAPLVVTCNGHSVDLSDEEAEFYTVDWEGTVDHSPHGSCATKLAGLLRDARQDPQPASDTHGGHVEPMDDPYKRQPEQDDTASGIDFDALPNGTVAEVTLLDGDRLLALKMDAVSGRNWFIGDCSDVDITKLCDVRIVYQPAPMSPGECLRGLLAGRDDAYELIEYAARHWVSNKQTRMTHLQYVLTGAIGDAARGGASDG